MAKLSIKAGATSITVNLFIQDSSSTTGAGLTGLAFNTASLVAYYALPAAAAVAITLATQTVTGGYSSGGFVEISSANMPGWYRFDVPNAAIASGRFSSIHLKGATNMAPMPLEIELTGWDNSDGVRGGMTALPNAAAAAANGLMINGANSGTNLSFGTVSLGGLTTNITGNLTGNVVGTVSTLTTYTGNTPQTGDVFATANAEPSGIIASNASLASKIAWLTSLSLNKITQTTTTMTLRNAADNGNISTSPTSDDGVTATRGAFV